MQVIPCAALALLAHPGTNHPLPFRVSAPNRKTIIKQKNSMHNLCSTAELLHGVTARLQKLSSDAPAGG